MSLLQPSHRGSRDTDKLLHTTAQGACERAACWPQGRSHAQKALHKFAQLRFGQVVEVKIERCASSLSCEWRAQGLGRAAHEREALTKPLQTLDQKQCALSDGGKPRVRRVGKLRHEWRKALLQTRRDKREKRRDGAVHNARVPVMAAQAPHRE
jgi:hypothetical protein